VEISFFDIANSANERSVEFEFDVGIAGDWKEIYFYMDGEVLASITKDGEAEGA